MTPAEMTPVPGTSHIKSIGHDGADLWVEFRSGALYSYTGAGAGHVAGMVKAPSAGKYFNAEIQGKTPHLKVSP